MNRDFVGDKLCSYGNYGYGYPNDLGPEIDSIGAIISALEGR